MKCVQNRARDFYLMGARSGVGSGGQWIWFLPCPLLPRGKVKLLLLSRRHPSSWDKRHFFPVSFRSPDSSSPYHWEAPHAIVSHGSSPLVGNFVWVWDIVQFCRTSWWKTKSTFWCGSDSRFYFIFSFLVEVIPHFPPLPLPPKISIMDMLVIVYLNSRFWNNGISVGIFSYHQMRKKKICSWPGSPWVVFSGYFISSHSPNNAC